MSSTNSSDRLALFSYATFNHRLLCFFFLKQVWSSLTWRVTLHRAFQADLFVVNSEYTVTHPFTTMAFIRLVCTVSLACRGSCLKLTCLST